MFHHLHGHSMYSNHNGTDALSSPAKLVQAAKDQGLASVCLTDHASVMGIPALVEACQEAGVKHIVGAELYVTNNLAWRPADKTDKSRRKYKHLVALAKNWEGFVELMELLSVANKEDHFYVRARNTLEECAAAKNLLFLTACAGGILCDDDAEKDLQTLIDGVGKENVFLEVQPHRFEEQFVINDKALLLSKQTGCGLVATQDFHYANKDDSVAHEVLLAVGQGKTWNDPDRFKYPVNDLYVKSEAEMLEAFGMLCKLGKMTPQQVLEAFANTERIAAQLDVEWRKVPISLPEMSDTPEETLMTMAINGLKEKGLMTPEYVARVQKEFKIMQESGFLMYFLVLEDIITWCRKENIMVGPARGSAGGSLICYLIGITQIDPIEHGLIFERFYRPGRVDLPDIDTDFEDERRDEVLAYCRDRFGEEYVAGVANYMMIKPKSAIKDASRVFGVDHNEANQATRYVPQTTPDDEVWDHENVRPFLDKHPLVENNAHNLVGTMRGMGQHAAGLVIAGVPIAGRASVWRKDDRSVACWDKRIIEDMGLMKLDILGLRTLSILRNASESVFRRTGKKVVFEGMKLDDPKVLGIFQQGHTTGVFQFESHGMRSLLRSLDLTSFSVAADCTALYRPGPMDLIPQYTLAQTGKVTPEYAHPLLEPILEPTYGIIVYQEQMMEVFRQVGGFDYAHADKMRKIVGKKLGPDEFRKHEGDFVVGAMAGYVDVQTDDGQVRRVHKMEKFKVNGEDREITVEEAMRDGLDIVI